MASLWGWGWRSATSGGMGNLGREIDGSAPYLPRVTGKVLNFHFLGRCRRSLIADFEGLNEAAAHG